MSVVSFEFSLNIKISGLRGYQFGKMSCGKNGMTYLQFLSICL